MTLRFGVFDDFKGARTLLMWGDEDGLARLYEVLTEFAEGRRRAASLHEMPWVTPLDGIRLALGVAADGRDEMLVSSSAVDWRCSMERFAEIAEKVASLLPPSSGRGHHYLDMRGEPLQVMVSKNEYAADLGVR